jgi:hypothetical protein
VQHPRPAPMPLQGMCHESGEGILGHR